MTFNQKLHVGPHKLQAFKNNLLSIWVFLFLFIGEVEAETVKPNFIIGDCDCSTDCFSNEVTNLECTDNKIKFKSKGLPHASHILMRGIKATNQQYPREHAYEIIIPNNNKLQPKPTSTDPGPIGVAINGVPLFDPGTQGPGSPHTLDKGELDECGGHAGRGDDYHYHIAPKCLIEDLGEEHVEQQKKPIGFANDGFPILAVGWFNKNNEIEHLLDGCRGTIDKNGNYFYNVKATSKWDILNCYAGHVKRISRDRWEARRDRSGGEIIGAKANFHISKYRALDVESTTCHIMEGDLINQRVLSKYGAVRTISSKNGAIFYCSSHCYAEFFEPEPNREYRGPVLFYELVTSSCPAGFFPHDLALFEPYAGPELMKKSAREGNKSKKKKKKRKKKK